MRGCSLQQHVLAYHVFSKVNAYRVCSCLEDERSPFVSLAPEECVALDPRVAGNPAKLATDKINQHISHL